MSKNLRFELIKKQDQLLLYVAKSKLIRPKKRKKRFAVIAIAKKCDNVKKALSQPKKLAPPRLLAKIAIN